MISQRQPLGKVEIRHGFFCRHVIGVLREVGIARIAEGTGGGIDRLRVSVGSQDGEPFGESPLDFGLQGVVDGTPRGLRVGEIGEIGNWREATARLTRRESGGLDRRRCPADVRHIQGLVGIGLLHQVQSPGPHVANIKEPGVPNLPLQIGAPLLDESVLEVKLERAHAGVSRTANVGEGVLNNATAAWFIGALLDQGQRIPDVAFFEVDEGGIGGFLEINVAKGLVIKNSIAATQNRFGIMERLPGNADARLKILSIGIL